MAVLLICVVLGGCTQPSSVIEDKVPDDIEIVRYSVYSYDKYNKYEGFYIGLDTQRFVVEGIVRNNLGRPVNSGRVIATFYKEYDHVAHRGYYALHQLAPSQSTGFEITVHNYTENFYLINGVSLSAEEVFN